MSEPGLFDVSNVVRKDASISADQRYRYTLTRDWSDPNVFVRQFATFVMLNPSTADARHDDPTIQRCMRFARTWGLDGIHVVNLYAFRTPQPSALWEAHATGVDIFGPENHKAIRVALLRAYSSCAPVIAAWGNHGAAGRVDWLIEQAQEMRVALQCLGTTNSGAPKHPLARGHHRIPDDVEPAAWSKAVAR